MEIDDPNRTWEEWRGGDGPFNVYIPDSERVSPPPSSIAQGRFSNWKNDLDWVPNLREKSLEEVQREAARIKKGEYFTSFKDFQRCLDSWCILGGRSSKKVKSKKDCLVRICHFATKDTEPDAHVKDHPVVDDPHACQVDKGSFEDDTQNQATDWEVGDEAPEWEPWDDPQREVQANDKGWDVQMDDDACGFDLNRVV